MRISSSMISDYHGKTLQKISERLYHTNEKLASGKKFTGLVDDPQAARKSMEISQSLLKRKRYMKAIDNAGIFQEKIQSDLTYVASHLQEARTIAVSTATPVLSMEERKTYAAQVDQVIEELASQSNGKYQGHYLYGGTESETPPFEFNRDAATNRITAANYKGNGEAKQLLVRDGKKMNANMPGDKAFADVFTSMIKFRDILDNTDGASEQDQVRDISNYIANLDSSINDNLNNLAKTGYSIAQLDRLTSEHQDEEFQELAYRSQIEDVDLPTTLIERQQDEQQYRSILYLISKNASGGLLDMLT